MVPNITLMEVKKFVESVPKVLKEDEMRREADRLHFSSKRRAHWLAFYLSVISSFPGHPPSSSFSPLAVLVPFHSSPRQSRSCTVPTSQPYYLHIIFLSIGKNLL
jgi:hypothetical protein